MEKTYAEREDIQDKFESHKEVVMRLESKLRESESIIQRLEREEIRQSSEISELKSQLNQKDNDLRMTLASMQEYQRTSTEERTSLRSELRLIFWCFVLSVTVLSNLDLLNWKNNGFKINLN